MVAAPLLRINTEPSIKNGLRSRFQVMVDKPLTFKRDKIGPVFGCIDAAQMTEFDWCLAIFVDIAKYPGSKIPGCFSFWRVNRHLNTGLPFELLPTFSLIASLGLFC